MKNHPAVTPATYVDVGAIIQCKLIQCKLIERAEQLLLNLDLEMSSVPSLGRSASVTEGMLPTVQAVRSRLTTVVAPGKPTAVVTLEDPYTEHSFSVEVTVVKAK